MDLPKGIRIEDNELVDWMYKAKLHLDDIDRSLDYLLSIVIQHRDNQNIMIKGFKQVFEQMNGMENYLTNSLKEKKAYASKKSIIYKYK